MPSRSGPMLAGWAAHALALVAWAYVAGISIPTGAPANHHHRAAASHGEHHPAPFHHDHERCPLCPLVTGGALAPPLFVLARESTFVALRLRSAAPERPFARTDLAIPPQRGPPAAA